MNPFLYSHVADGALRHGMVAAVPKSHHAYATAIAHIAEFDGRRLYAPEGYPSMCAFCVRELQLSEQVARKLIRVGRASLRFPEIFLALADGRLNGSGVILLAPQLTTENAAELLAAAARKSNDEIRELLADRAPKLDVPLSLSGEPGDAQVSVRTPGRPAEPESAATASGPLRDAGNSTQASARTPPVSSRRPGLNPLGAGRFETRFTMGSETNALMKNLEELLGRRVTSDDIDRALALGFKTMTAGIEKRRYAATEKPRAQRKPAKGRHIPAAVKRAVVKRDGGRCTFIADSGRRCEARGRLEFDHIEPVARGGKSTADNLRLRCRAHNQYEAERLYGASFMQTKRDQASAGAGTPVAPALAAPTAPAPTAPANTAPASAAPANSAPAPAARQAATQQIDDLDLTPWLRRLGFRKEEVRRAAAYCGELRDATLEQRVRAALSYLRPPARVSRPLMATTKEEAGAAQLPTPAPAGC